MKTFRFQTAFRLHARSLLCAPMIAGAVGALSLLILAPYLSSGAEPEKAEPATRRAIDQGLAYLASKQARNGRWEGDQGAYPVAMTALAGLAFLLDGNTTLQGRYSKNVQGAVGYLVEQSQPNGLIGNPTRDSRYMYGHGFSMLFLSQVLGEEEDLSRRRQLVDVLQRAVEFTGRAQTINGGWGYLSAIEGNQFDEGSVTITQMQGLRSCRNSGIHVPKEIIDKGVKYIEQCTDKEGGVRYSLKTAGGPRPAITAAAVVCLFSAGEHDNPLVKRLVAFSEKAFASATAVASYGHWHYAHYYYAQVVYRLGDEKWSRYKKTVFKLILDQQGPDGAWNEGYIGPVYTTALSLAILQIENGMLPIYQR